MWDIEFLPSACVMDLGDGCVIFRAVSTWDPGSGHGINGYRFRIFVFFLRTRENDFLITTQIIVNRHKQPILEKKGKKDDKINQPKKKLVITKVALKSDHSYHSDILDDNSILDNPLGRNTNQKKQISGRAVSLT
jgi:hypothetical protein